MSDTPSLEIQNPAVLRFRGLDLEAMNALQRRNIAAVRRMANLMLDNTEIITERQYAFLKASAGQMNAALDRGESASDPQAIYNCQAEAYRDLFEMLTTHVGELAEITSRCCIGQGPEAIGSPVERRLEKIGAEPSVKRAGGASRTSPAKDA